MRRLKNSLGLLALTLSILLTACGGGGGGGGGGGSTFALNGGAVSTGFSAAMPLQTYTFNAVADTTYTVSVTTTSGDTLLEVYNGSSYTTGTLIGWSWNSRSTTPYNTVSFLANFTGPVTVLVTDGSLTGAAASYTIEASSGEIPIGGTRTASTYAERIYYQFEAQSGTAYQVRLTPQNGDVNIGSIYPKMGTSVGSSSLTGTATDTVTFLAPATQRYYVEAAATSASTTFGIQVVTTTTNPDLSVSVDSAVSDGTNVTVNYTVHNGGINSAGPFNVDAWSDSASAPTVGSTGQGSAPIASLAGGASVSGSLVIPNAAASGTAYAIVDTANAVAETNENNNVSAGKAWTKPLTAPQSFDFENATVPTSFAMSGNTGWVIDSTTGSASTHSLKAGAITDNQSSCFSMSVYNAQSISYDYAVSSEAYGDYLRFYIDGTEQWAYAATGIIAWTSTGAIPVTSGVHTYKWCYVKDYAFLGGSDTAWVDNIVVTAAPPPTVDLAVAINSAVSNGSSVTVDYTVTNSGNSASGPFAVDFWSNSASAPAVGSAGQTSVQQASLAGGASVNGQVVIPNANASGTAYAIVDTTNQVVETNEANNVSAGYAWTANTDLVVTVTKATSDRTNVTVYYTVTNQGANAAGGFRVDLWSNSASAPTVGMTGEANVSISGLNAGATSSGSVVIPNANASGTAYAIVDTLNQVAEAVETNNVSAGVAWTEPVLAPQSYNFNTGVVPPEFVMSGNAAWVANTSGKGANTVYSLKAGTITNSQASCVAVSAANSSSASFSYSVSSELNFDFLSFYIDGVLQAQWSGSVAWTASTAYSAGTAGVHEFKWCYSKDVTGAAGSDTAWIDNVTIN